MKIGKWQIDSLWMVLGGFALLFLVTFTFCWIIGGNQRLAILIVMLKIIGLGTSIFLIIGKLGHPWFDKVCFKGDKLDCQAVIESPAAAFFGVIHTADLGGIYFSGGIILICFSLLNPHFFHQVYLLAVLNVLTLPYTIFSVVYQAFVVKRWCALCLIVQLIFWLEFSQFYSFLFAGVPQFAVKDFYLIVWSFGLPILTWLFFRPLVKKAIEADKQENLG